MVDSRGWHYLSRKHRVRSQAGPIVTIFSTASSGASCQKLFFPPLRNHAVQIELTGSTRTDLPRFRGTQVGAPPVFGCDSYRYCRSLVSHTVIGGSSSGCGGCCTAQKIRWNNKSAFLLFIGVRNARLYQPWRPRLISRLDHRITASTVDPREACFLVNLFMWLVSISMQFILLIYMPPTTLMHNNPKRS